MSNFLEKEEYGISSLSKFIGSTLTEFFSQENNQTDFFQNIQKFVSKGGKRIRPILMYYGYRLFKNENIQEVLYASISLELLHAFLLIHDDIMDQSNFRWRLPTIHKLYEEVIRNKNKEQKDYRHFGTSMALLTGDYLGMLAYKPLLNTNIPPDIKLRLISKLTDTVLYTIIGQERDLIIQNIKKTVSVSDIIKMYMFKTAQYTFETPLQMGALWGGATIQDMELISEFAIPCGIAYQIKDDILDLFAKEEDLKKPIGLDIKEGKKTLLIVKTLKNSTKKDQKFILRQLGNKNCTNEEIIEVKNIIINVGAHEFCQKKCEEYIIVVKKALKKFCDKKWNKKVIDQIDYIANFSIARTY